MSQTEPTMKNENPEEEENENPEEGENVNPEGENEYPGEGENECPEEREAKESPESAVAVAEEETSPEQDSSVPEVDSAAPDADLTTNETVEKRMSGAAVDIGKSSAEAENHEEGAELEGRMEIKPSDKQVGEGKSTVQTDAVIGKSEKKASEETVEFQTIKSPSHDVTSLSPTNLDTSALAAFVKEEPIPEEGRSSVTSSKGRQSVVISIGEPRRSRPSISSKLSVTRGLKSISSVTHEPTRLMSIMSTQDAQDMQIKLASIEQKHLPQQRASIASHQIGFARKSMDRRTSRIGGQVDSSLMTFRSSTLTTARIKISKYANTYRLESKRPFSSDRVNSVIQNLLESALDGVKYDPINCAKLCMTLSAELRTRVKVLGYDSIVVSWPDDATFPEYPGFERLWMPVELRWEGPGKTNGGWHAWKMTGHEGASRIIRYKIICVLDIGEKKSQDVFSAARFLWDGTKDKYSSFTFENSYIYAIASVYGIYFE